MTLAIRGATEDDAERVAAIYAHYVANSVVTFDVEAMPAAAWRDKLHDLAARGLPFLVADADGEVAGYAYLTPWRPKPAYRHTAENSVYLDPRYHGRGTGTALLAELLALAGKAGIRQVIAVIADSGSDASPALHRKLGFTEAGRLTAVGHKHGRWIDTLLMQRRLT
jgi:L-amino acid N-acyltransferase YncA